MRFRYCLFFVLLAISFVLGEEKCGEGKKCPDLTEEEESVKDPRSPYPQAPKAQSDRIREYHKRLAENKKKAAEAVAKGQKKAAQEAPTPTTTQTPPTEAPTTTTPPPKQEKTTETSKEQKKEEKPKKKAKKIQEKSKTKKSSSTSTPKRSVFDRAGDFFVSLMDVKLAEFIDKNYKVVIPGFLFGCCTMGAFLGWLFSTLISMIGLFEEEKGKPEFVEVTDDEEEENEEVDTESGEEEVDSTEESEC